MLALVSQANERRQLLLDALSVMRRIGVDWGIGRALLHLASLEPADRSRRLFEEAGRTFERIGHDEGIGSVCRGAGDLALGEGKLDEAERLYQRAMDLWMATEYGTFVPALALSMAARMA